jgi:carbon starvation protein
MQRVIFNDYVDVSLCIIYIVLVLTMLVFALLAIRDARASAVATTREIEDDMLQPAEA